MSSPGGVEFGGVLWLILGRAMVPRWRPSGSPLGYLGRQPEMSQDSLHNRRLFNQPYEAQSPPTARTREDIEPTVSAFCRRYHIQRLALFGSVLRDDFTPDSDVDVLVEFQAGHVPGLDFVSMEREFSRLLQGQRVDMVTPKFLNPRIRDQVLTSAEPLYVAA